MGLAISMERLAALIDPAEELDGDQRLQRAGQALDRFERYIQLSPSGCHLWTGSVTTDGYGQFFLSGRLYPARRVAYELCVGPIGPEERVFANCGVRACVNYRHLEARPVALRTLPRRPIHP